MANFLEGLLANTDGIGFKLIPHVEEAALKYVIYNSVMASRVATKTDMSGWNARKISEYVRSRRAQTLSEDTAIPNTQLRRVRKETIEPIEVGERYDVSDRRADTDMESIMSDVVSAIGEAITDRVEQDLLTTALSTFVGGSLGSASTDWSLNLMLQGATMFRARARHAPIFHVVHPYQALTEMEKLIQYNNSSQQADLRFRDDAASQLGMTSDLRTFRLPVFGITDLSIAEQLPRRVTYKLATDATGGTFRLQIGDGHVVGTNITAAITYSATPATLVSNIQAAIDALPTAVTGGTWVVSGTDVTDLTLTPPAGAYLSESDRLRGANKFDEDAVIVSDTGTTLMKSGYDLLTGTSSVFTDKDGTDVGFQLYERTGATAKSLLFQPQAIIWDIRKSITSHFALPTDKSGRTAQFSGYMTYGIGQWSPELGMFIETKAEAPDAV